MRPDSRSSPRGSARDASANVTSQSVRCGSFDGTTDTSLSEAASMPNRSEMARRTSWRAAVSSSAAPPRDSGSSWLIR